MMDSLTIRNAEVILPGNIQKTDVAVSQGKISAIGKGLADCGEVINAEGLFLLPGIIDPQVHFREPGSTDKEDLHSGSCAAAAGGVTSFLDMPNNNPPVITVQRMKEKKQLAAEKSVVNYGFFMGATPDNLDELNAVENVCGIKIFMGSSTGNLLVDDPLVLEKIFAGGSRLIAVHAEDEAVLRDNMVLLKDIHDVRIHSRVRDESAALRATKLAVRLSLKYRRRLHILHLTTEDECDFLRTLPREHLISTEVCPQHFTLTAPECYEQLGTLAQMNPPIRTRRHADALWQALKDGIIDCIATDHAPHTLAEKDQSYGKAPAGMPGVETSLPLMLDRVNQNHCSLQQVVHWMSEAPAKLYAMQGKGRIEVGHDADLVLVDLDLKKTVRNGDLKTKVNWSPYHGMELKGWPVRTIVNGKTVFLNGEVDKSVRGREICFAS
ncbi:MAG: dihydroorotase [SAR324 cluster bacterium]|nr:dihydroorotase [SAR324 cluster bacterium]MBL7036109.1 dihydroorotase [SAR324 cluster bacterium]